VYRHLCHVLWRTTTSDTFIIIRPQLMCIQGTNINNTLDSSRSAARLAVRCAIPLVSSHLPRLTRSSLRLNPTVLLRPPDPVKMHSDMEQHPHTKVVEYDLSLNTMMWELSTAEAGPSVAHSVCSGHGTPLVTSRTSQPH